MNNLTVAKDIGQEGEADDTTGTAFVPLLGADKVDGGVALFCSPG